MIQLIAIGSGGFLGALCRYGISRQMFHWFGPSFPYATLTVNSAGSFMIGLLTQYFLLHPTIPEALRMGLTVGFLGALTTFSTFSYESLVLLQSGEIGKALINILSNCVVCLTLCALGFQLAKTLS